MSAATTNVGIRLSLDGVQAVEAGLGRVQTMAGGAAKALAGIAAGSISIAGLTAFVKGAIDAADETAKVAQKTGLAAEQVAGLRLAFEQSGGAVDQFVPIMAKLSVAVVNGNKALDAMGISSKNADGSLKSVRQVLGEVSNQFAGYEDGARKTALAVALLGEEGAKMLPFLNQGAAALDEYDKKAKDLGLTLDQETAKAAERFNDSLDLIKKNVSGAGISIAKSLLPTLEDLTSAFALATMRGDGLLEKLRLFGSTTYSTKGFNLGKDIREAQETIEDLTKARDRYLRANSDTSGIDQALSSATKKLEYFRELQRMTIKYSAEDQSSAEARRLGLEQLKMSAPVIEQAAKASTVKAKADREAAEALKARVAAQVSANAAFDEEFKRIEDIRLAGEARIQSAREMLESIQRETALLGLSNLEKEKSIALWELERRGVVAGKEAYDAFAGKISAAIEARNARQQQLDQEKAAIDQAKAAAAEWEKTSEKIEDALTDALMRGFENGKSFGENLGDTVSNYFKTTVAEAIASAITKAIMSALASTQWGQFFSGILGGGGGLGNIGGSLISSAAQSYMSGGSALGSSVSAAGAYLNGSMSGANAAGSIYANYTGAGIDGLLATNSAYGTASAGSAAGASSATWISAVGYAALIAAAVVVAENLYSKGYTRTAVGVGPGTTQRFGNTTFTSDPSMGRSPQYDFSTERLNRELFDFLGMSEKWADIFSGTTRMGTLFGRKLGAYGFEADIAGGEATVGGFARYKGGIFRSNKTVDIEVDPRDAEYVKQVTENTIEGARGMARAMGLNAEAIDEYTGSLKVNMKGAETAEEQAKRMAESMDELSFQLLKTASGGKLAREELDKMMEGVRQSIQNAGISTEGITGVLTDGILNGLSGEEIGANLSQMILGGIVQTFAQQAFAPVAQAMMSQIITPIFTAIAAGVPISQAVSKVAIQNIVETAKQAMEVMNAIFNSAEMQEFFGSLNEAFAGVGAAAAGVRVPNFRPVSIKPPNTAAQETAREREQLERELLRLQGNTTELRRRELNDLKPSNRALQERIWALEDERAALDKVKELQDVWSDLTDSIEDEIKRLRDLAVGDTAAGLAFLQSQFAIVTAQARAMDQEAAGRLPELSGQLADAYLNTATSRSDYQARVNALAASLEETNRITRNTAGINADTTQKVKDEELAAEIKLLQQSIAVLTSRMEENNKAANTTATALGKASAGGAIRIVAA